MKKIPRRISAGESFGSSVHNTLKKWGEAEIGNKRKAESEQPALFEEQHSNTNSYPLTANRLTDLWHQSFIIEGYTSRVEADAARKKGEKLMEHFFAWWSGKERNVLAVEKGFSVQADDTKITGRYDRVESVEDGVHIIDYKTGSPRSQEEVDTDLQLSIYALAAEESFGMPCTKLTLLFLYEDELIERTTERSAGQLKDAQKQIHSLYERIEKQDYHPTPGRNICKRCPYNRVCDVAAI